MAGAAIAQSPPPPATDMAKIDFSALDKDVNSYLTKDEAMVIAELESVFDTLDSDHDGKISSAEFTRWSRAGKSTALPRDPSTAPSGSAGSQHMPRQD
jgi:EF hand